ncbi:MAG TPA: glycosyltransferase family 2 protein [Anaerolineales bacterium]|nr:glycosyltransferase family 2 protein [Anaerolineales bacterium]
MKPVDLSIIVVNYKTKEITLDCLRYIYASKTKYTYEVILVDNASGDDSVAAFKKVKWPLTLIENHQNGGFANGNNLGAKSAKGTYLWLLNSDTLIEPDTIEKLLNLATKHNSYLATCRLLNRDGSVQPQGGALPNALNLTTWMLNLDSILFLRRLIPPYQLSNPYPKNPKIGWIAGTAMLIRRDLYQSIGGLDEHIFMYGEDVEFCLRAHQGDIKVDYFYQPKLIHLGQASGSSERAILGEFSGLQYIYRKHQTSGQRAYLKFILKLGALLRIISFALRGDIKRRDIYVKAFKLA